VEPRTILVLWACNDVLNATGRPACAVRRKRLLHPDYN